MPGSIQSIERAAAILSLLAAGRRARLADIAASLQLPRGTVHGILRTLCEVGFADHDPDTGRYMIGWTLLNLDAGHLDDNELRARSMNWADPLAARSGQTVRVATLAGRDVLIVHHVFRPDDSPQAADVGGLLPAHATALGKALLAYHPAEAALLPEQLRSFTVRTISDRALLAAELARVRQRQVAMELGEHVAGQASIAAPIHGIGGLVVAAIAVHGPEGQLFDGGGQARSAVVSQVERCARAITRELRRARAPR